MVLFGAICARVGNYAILGPFVGPFNIFLVYAGFMIYIDLLELGQKLNWPAKLLDPEAFLNRLRSVKPWASDRKPCLNTKSPSEGGVSSDIWGNNREKNDVNQCYFVSP